MTNFLKTKGFTLIELVIAISIFSIIIFVMTNLLISVMRNPQLELSSISSIDQARMVATNFTNEIRSAAYGTYPLVEASNSEIIFYSPFGSNSGNINKIRYYISGSTLYKGVIIPVNGVYNSSLEVVSAVLTGLTNGSDPLFYYYNGDYYGNENVTPLSSPVNVNDVKFVGINLEIQNQENPQNSSFFLKAGAAIRILKNNLSD